MGKFADRVVDALEEHKRLLAPAVKQLMAEAWDEGIEAAANAPVPECDYARNPYRPTP